ncbi:hypothetical protein SAY87_010611 [Trapa incisa]|uniref:Uncharacterized protein n=1 Tax=Trapa incisa TaxID=236973 RepID=A0AAN7GUG9_9MYRT|nr:hypothetical protein SAY87_010611 [Trapa incisa]
MRNLSSSMIHGPVKVVPILNGRLHQLEPTKGNFITGGKMRVIKTEERPQRSIQAKPPLGKDVAGGSRSGRRSQAEISSPRNRRIAHAGCGEQLKGNYGQKEILRRALMSPARRRFSLRWLNFRPTPSRLSSMSTA